MQRLSGEALLTTYPEIPGTDGLPLTASAALLVEGNGHAPVGAGDDAVQLGEGGYLAPRDPLFGVEGELLVGEVAFDEVG